MRFGEVRKVEGSCNIKLANREARHRYVHKSATRGLDTTLLAPHQEDAQSTHGVSSAQWSIKR
jgi:hypothetical protein